MAGLPSRVLLLAVVLAALGCDVTGIESVSSSSAVPAAAPRAGHGRVVVYLNGPAQSPLPVAFDLVSIEAVRADGTRAPVSTPPTTVNSLEIVGRQRLLAEGFVPYARYTGLALGIARARVRQEGRWTDLSVPTEGVVLPGEFEVRRGEASALFLTWDVGRAIEGEAFFRPAFAVEGRAQELRGVLAYVTNEAADTMSVIDRDTDRVVSVLEVGRGPKGVTVSTDATRAYVVNSAAHTLTVIDVNMGRVIHTTNLEVGAGASDIVVTPDGGTLYVSNTALSSVSAISATSFQLLRSVPVGLRPIFLAVVPNRPLLLAVNTASHDLSAIDTARNVVVATVPLDLQPSGVAVDAGGTQAFVSHLGSPRLSVVSLSSFRVVRTANAGAASSVLLDRDGNIGRVFLPQPRAPRLSVFNVTLNAEIGVVEVGAQPRDMALDTDREKLYVVNRGSNSVTVVDRNSQRVRATIQVGKGPYAIAIVP